MSAHTHDDEIDRVARARHEKFKKMTLEQKSAHIIDGLQKQLYKLIIEQGEYYDQRQQLEKENLGLKRQNDKLQTANDELCAEVRMYQKQLLKKGMEVEDQTIVQASPYKLKLARPLSARTDPAGHFNYGVRL